MVRRLEPPREVLVVPSTPRPSPCEDCTCDQYQVLNHPHLGLSLKPGQIYAFCQLEGKCKGDRSKVRQLSRALEKVDLFRKMPQRQGPVQAPCTPTAAASSASTASPLVSILKTPAPETPRTPAPRTRKKGKQSDDSHSLPATPVKWSKASEQDLWDETPVPSPWTPSARNGAKTPWNGAQTPRGDVLGAVTPTSTREKVTAFESMALQTLQHSSLMDAGIVDTLLKPCLQEALINEDLELTVATLSLLLELPLTPLNVVGFHGLFKRFREQMPVVRFLLRAITASVSGSNVVPRAKADDIEDFFDMRARPQHMDDGDKGTIRSASSKLLKRRKNNFHRSGDL